MLMLAALAQFEGAASATAEGRQVRFAVRAIGEFAQWAGVGAPDEITQASLQAWVGELAGRGLAASTIRNRISAVSAFCGYLVEIGELPSNPCRTLRLPRIERRPPLYLDRDEYRQALRVSLRAGVFCEVALALLTGLRLAELRALRWNDVDLAGKKLIVRRGKGGKFRRVWLNHKAIRVLKCQRRRTLGREYVFPGRKRGNQTGMRRMAWWHSAIKPLQEAIPKFRQLPPGSTGRGWHLLRHTFASRAVQAGISIFKVSDWLGHSDVRVTQERYAFLSGEYDADIERV